jgi:hypothetical protein
MDYNEFFNYQISGTSPLEFASWLNNEFLQSCPKELETKTRKLEFDSGIVEPDEADPSYHFCITGFAFYGKSRASEDKKDKGMQQPASKKELRVIPPELSERSLVDIEIRIMDENGIQVVCTWKNKHIRLIEFLKNLKEQIQLNYNPVAVNAISGSDLLSGPVFADADSLLFEFIFWDSPETFLDWCHTELVIMYPGFFNYTGVEHGGEGSVVRAGGRKISPDENESAWGYAIFADYYGKDDKLVWEEGFALIYVRPIGNNQCYVQCFYDPCIGQDVPEIDRWLVKLEERAKTLNASPMEIINNESSPTENSKSWMRIPDHYWDREAVKMWCNGHTNTEIANKVGVEPRSVTNRLSQLRRLHPEAGIPYHAERRKLMIKRDKP